MRTNSTLKDVGKLIKSCKYIFSIQKNIEQKSFSKISLKSLLIILGIAFYTSTVSAQEVSTRIGNTLITNQSTSKTTAKAASINALAAVAGSIDVANASAGYNSYTADQLVRNILTSGCLTVNNVRFGYYKRNNNNTWTWNNHTWSSTAGNRQLGYYNKATSTFPIDEGLLLSTGRISSAMGPNTYTNKTDEMVEEASDPDLTTISGKTMHDASILEFDFIPDGNLVEFKFVFASEEYLEYVHTNYNDAFGFFLSGFGITGPYTNNAINLAQLPNGDAVTINNIHSAGTNVDNVSFPDHNVAYYSNNPLGSATMEFDGATVVLTATYAVTPGKNYKIKMAIADAYDQKWDAGVFLKAKSFATNTLVITNPAPICANGTTNITLPAITAGSTAGLTYSYWKDAAATIPYTTPTAATVGTYYIKGLNAQSGCSDIKPVVVSQTNIVITETTASHIDIKCKGLSTGSATVTASGGTGAYTYSWNTSPVQTSATAINLAAGTYTVTVTDAKGCNNTKQIIITEPSTILSATTTQVDIICNGATTGSATAVPSGGAGAYTYSWNTNPIQTLATATGLAAGTYIVTIKDANLCTVNKSVTILQPTTALTLAASSKTDASCFGASTGSVTAGAVTNAVGTVTYNWKNALNVSVGTTATVSNLSAGTYTLTVTDNCSSKTNSVTILQPSAALALAASSKTDASCNGASTGSVTAGAVTNFVGTVTYSWKNSSNTVVGTTASVTGLAAGTYTLTVTDSCSSQSNSVTIGQPALPLALAASSKTDASCNGASTGSVTAGAVTNFVGTVTYSWKNSSNTVVGTTASVTGLAAGTYTLTVTDSCSSQSNMVTIGQPALPLALAPSSKTDASCNGASSGSVTAGVVTNFVGTISYSWKNSSNVVVGTTASVTGLAAGTYTLTVTDSCSSQSNSVTIGQPALPLALAASSKTDASCNGASTGSVTAGAVTNFVETITYSWKNSSNVVVGTTASVTGLAAGTYTLTVTDSCSSQSNSVTIGQPALPLALAASSKTDASCNGASTGSVTAGAVTNFVGTVTYSWKNSSNTVVGTTASVTGLAAGTYTLTVTDSCSSQSNSVTIGQPALPLTLAASSKTDASCNGASTGSVTAGAVTNFVGTVTYSWKNSSNTVVGTTAAVTGLPAGTYTLTVTDSCSSQSNSVTIGQPALPLALAASSKTDASCNGASSGSVTAGAVTNFVGTITYSWKNSSNVVVGTTASVTGLAAGTYTLTVTDSCSSQSNSVTIGQPALPLALAASSKTDASCNGASTGSVTAGAVTNFVGTVTYSWKNSSNTVVGTTASVTGLAAGTYTLTVTDSCSSKSNTVTIGQPALPLALAASSKTDASCNGASTGSVTAGTVTNFVGTVTYSWKNSSNTVVGTTASVTGLAAGTYTLTVTDSCSSQSNSVTIGQPALPLALATSSKTDASCNGASTGSVTAGTVTNFVGTVTYSWKNSSNVVVGTTASVTGLAVGTYTLTVTDSCSSKSNSVTIGQPALPLALAASFKTDASCNGASTGSVTAGAVTNFVGTVTYSWKNSSNTVVGTTASVTGLAAGTYTLTVTDSCSSQSNSVTIGQPALPLALAASSKTDASCNGASTGSVTAGAVTNFVGTVTYSWKNSSNTVVGTTASVTGLAAGTYTLTVTDSCSSQSNSVTIGQPALPLALAASSKTDASCFGDSTGSVTAGAVTNAVGTVTYSWKNSSNTVVGTTASVSGLIAGTYTLTVTDSCSSQSNSVTIGQPSAALSCSITQNKAVTSNGLSDGEATVTAIGGNGGYTYKWDNNETTQKAVALNAGLHSVTVTDSKGCTTTCTITISQPNVLSCSITQNAPAKCYGDNNGIATVTAIGGNGDYTYKWDNNETTAQATALTAGLHTVTVTDKLGYKTTCDVIIGQPQAALTAAIKIDTNVNCKGGATGSATASATGGNGTYSYSWNTSPIQTSATANNLISGTYIVTVTDAKGCTDTEQITITEPELALTAAIKTDTNVNCKGDATGSATASATGGTGTYSYSWNTNPIQTSATANNLIAGTYIVTVTDVKGCTDTEQITITEPELALTAAIKTDTNVNCKGDATGSATASATGGTGTYSYSWNTSPFQTSATANNLIAGTYIVTVTDAKGCTDTEQITITEPELALTAAIKTDTNVNCKGDATGSATASATGGTGTYSYSWNTSPIQTSATANNLIAGTYIVTVTDAKGCTDTEQITITEPELALTAAIKIDTNVNCKGDATGSATASATGGTGTYSYSWNTSPIQTSATANNLIAGTYIVTVTDEKGCTDTEQITITEPEFALTAAIKTDTNVNCKGDATGSATASATGGTGTYSYSWNTNPIQTSATANNLIAGTHIVTVTDAKGCTDTEQITITEPELALTAAIKTDTNVNCKGDATGSATASATGGTGTYSYSWNTSPIQTSATANNLIAGTYIVTVTDEKGCTDTEQITITEPEFALTAAIKTDTNVNCKGDATGSATASATGGTGTYSYSWNTNPIQTSATANNLIAGTHIVTVTDAKGCTDTEQITITEPELALTAAIKTDTNVNCKGDATGSATASATGGTGTFSYSWNTSPIQTSATANNLIAGTYIVTVTDAKGCTDTEQITITEPELALTASQSQVNASCGGASSGSATVIASGGTSSYTYSWNTTPEQTSATATNLAAGNYSVLITDSKGCTHTVSFEILDGDSVKPIIDPLPETSTINCPAEPEFAQATATDDNGTIASLTYEDTVTPGNCAGSYTKTRTWTAKDTCENISLPVSQTIIVQDITAPTWSTEVASLDKIIECSDTAALTSAQALFPTASDLCDTDVSNIVKVSGLFVASADCSNAGTYTNTWTVKDDCGNTSDTFTQVIKIQDTTKPTFIGELPTDITVSCDAVPEPANLEASDNCNGNLPIVFNETKSDIQNGCSTNYTLTRTWTTSDCGLNTATYTQIITVRDTTAPTGTAPADVANLQTIADIPVGNPADIKDAADNCSTTVDITVSDANNEGSGCDGNAYILTRTYTLTDCAGNKTELKQTFTVENKVSVSGVASHVTCFGGKDGLILVTNSPGSTVVIRNENNEVVGNSNLPAGTYTLTATSSVNNGNETCSATATVVITQPTYTVKISGQIINKDTNTPIANVPVTLVPQGTTTGPILMRITGADGLYNFSGMVAGSYLVQVQDANLNSAYQLYPIDSSLFFTTLEDCKIQEHNFEYGKSTLPVLGDYVWYDTNGNGVQDEWYDANNDGVVTKNIPDGNGAIDYSQWEWIDLNGDGSYTGPSNVGELNAGGFGNALSANVIIDGPNGYHQEVIVGIEGFWRDRPDTANPYGDYTIKLVKDANLDAVATSLGATGLVKVLPSITDKKVPNKTGKSQLHTVCSTTGGASGYIVTVTPEDLVHLDADFGVNCKVFSDIVANDDSAGPIAGVNNITKNVLNVLPNDTLECAVVTASDVIITTVTPNEFLQLNADGSVEVLANAPVGTLTLVYQICEADQTTNCDTATVTVTIEAPVMTVTATPICVNDVPYIDYVVTPVNFTPENGVTIAWANTSDTVITTMTNLPLTGRVLWPGAVVDQSGKGIDWPGWVFQNNKWIEAPDGFETLRPLVKLTISTNPSETIIVEYPKSEPYCTGRPTFAIVANDDNAGPISAGATNVLNIYNNDTLNAAAVNPADVTLTIVTPDPKGALTLNPDGSVDVAAGTPDGTYTLTYQICENADAGNCDTAIVTVIVTEPAAPPTPVVANDDVYTNIGCNTFGLVGNVLANDFKGITRASLELVNFTLLSSNNNAKTDPNITFDALGNVTVSSLTPAGTYTYSYQICDKLSADNCDTATVTITVVPNGITNIASKACNDDSTLIDLLSLLPENTPSTGVWIDANNSNTIQGNTFNALGLALGNYTFEYKITDQNCPRSILLTMEINDDCKVLACGNVVVHNAFSPNGDGINDVFKIDNIDDITCYPENNVEIYNRWGILVFETDNYNNTTNAFDGISRGRTTVKQSDGLPTGTYFYIINYKSLDGNNVLQNNKKDGYLYLSK